MKFHMHVVICVIILVDKVKFSMFKKPLYTVMLFLLVTPMVFSDQTVVESKNESSKSEVSEDQAEVAKYVYCPGIKSLARDDVSGKWNAPDGWFSVSYSFAKKIDHYLGAAFTGGNIGHIECYYTSSETGDKRIVLKNTKLVELPKLDVWQVSDQNSKVSICKPNTDQDCPFILYQENQHPQDLESAILNMPK